MTYLNINLQGNRLIKPQMYGRLFMRPSYSNDIAFQATFSNMVNGATELETFILCPKASSFVLEARRNNVLEQINYEVNYNNDRYEITVRLSKEVLEKGPLLLKAKVDDQECEARLHFNRLVKPTVPDSFINSFTVQNINYRFYVDNPKDEIQGRFHAKGKIYEKDILDYIRPMLPVHPVILDIGANVGNHAIYMEKTFEPEEILVFEAHEKTVELLNINLALNDCRKINCLHLGLCVSDSHSHYEKKSEHINNLGSVSFAESANEGCNSIWPDKDMSFVKLDFIKIDVEGMELKVLNGLEETINRFQPLLLVETNLKTNSLVLDWLEKRGYSIDRAFHPYPGNWMYLAYAYH